MKVGDKVVCVKDMSRWYKGMIPGAIFTVREVRVMGPHVQIRIAEWEEAQHRTDFWSVEIGAEVYFVPFPECWGWNADRFEPFPE